MNIEQAKEHIGDIIRENNTVRHSDMVVFEQEKEALRTAIQSLEMWDKVIAEIEHLTYYWCEVHPRSVIDDVLQIIEKYKKEIEK